MVSQRSGKLGLVLGITLGPPALRWRASAVITTSLAPCRGHKLNQANVEHGSRWEVLR